MGTVLSTENVWSVSLVLTWQILCDLSHELVLNCGHCPLYCTENVSGWFSTDLALSLVMSTENVCCWFSTDLADLSQQSVLNCGQCPKY